MASVRSVTRAPSHNQLQQRMEDELGPAILEACNSLWREYTGRSEKAPAEFAVGKQDLLNWYAELQFKIRGPGKCSQCRAPVRHALKVRAEHPDGSVRTYLCLCTRCLVAEEALSDRLRYRIGSEWVERPAKATRKSASERPHAA